MTEKLKQTIKEEVSKLPKEAQSAINAFDWVSVTEELGKKYSLNESQLNDFQVQTLLVLIGVLDYESYEDAVVENASIEKNVVLEISDEVFAKIFLPIGDALEENIKKNTAGKETGALQNIDFILSGGDYSVFIKPQMNHNYDEENPDKILGSSNIVEVKNKLIN